MDWDDLKFFLALFECETMSKAAQRLGVTHATVSRRIEKMERAIKLKLFDRTDVGYKPTIEGENLYAKSSDIRRLFAELEDGVLNKQTQRTVTISMVPFLADHLVIEKLLPLHAKFPKVRFEINTLHKNVNIVKQEADVAIRLNRPESGECQCRKLASLPYVIYGNSYWLDKVRNNEKNISIITYTAEYKHLPECDYLIKTYGNHSIKLQTNCVSAQKKAAEVGYGISLLPKIVVKNEPYLLPLEEIAREVWMLTPNKNLSSVPKQIIATELIKMFASLS